MGVSQLLKELKPCLRDSHVENFHGQTVAIDGNAFIFRGAYSCSEQVATGQPSPGAVEYVMKRIHMLEHYGVRPWVVLDGRRTPMKEDTNNSRREQREKNLRIALDLKRQAGDASGGEKEALLQKAQTFFQKAIYVTRQMVTNTMEALKQKGVKCMVAPYEADAQVAFLVKCGLASAVITEDSDILVYMAAVKSTAPALYKMDAFGKCQELSFDADKLSSLPGQVGKVGRGLKAFAGEGGGRMFVQLATLAGCDYVDNVKGLGLVTALPIISRFRSAPADRRIQQVLMYVHKKGKIVPDGHRQRMLRAELSFFWHRVYDPRSKTCVHFCAAVPELIGTAEIPELPASPGDCDFLGEHISEPLIAKIARGEVDPVTGEAVTAEVTPTPPENDLRRCSTYPNPNSRQILPSVPVKSSSMPATTPRPALRQRAPSQHGLKKVSAGGGRAVTTPCNSNAKGSGLLKDMFDRARAKASKKENTPVGHNRHRLQDVSHIVMACRPERTPSRSQHPASDRATSGKTGCANPFARKQASGKVHGVFSPSIFLTPATTNAAAAGPPVLERGERDAWSRFRQGPSADNLLVAADARGDLSDDDPVILTVITEENRNENRRPRPTASETADGSDRTVALPSGKKRSISDVVSSSTRRGCGGRSSIQELGPKKRQTGRGKKSTMLSFFGRTAAPNA